MTSTEINPDTRSSFINVFAWIMIILNGFNLFFSIIQYMILTIIRQFKEFDKVSIHFQTVTFRFPSFMIKNMHLIFLLSGIIALVSLISAIGLLKRKEWARKAFLFLIAFAMVNLIASDLLRIYFMNSTFHLSSNIPIEFHVIQGFMIFFMLIFSLSFLFLFGWLFKKLSSSKIKMEFNPGINII